MGLTARLASSNEHKLEELRAALPTWSLELLGRASFPPEEGETYYANARAKALAERQIVLSGYRIAAVLRDAMQQ